MVDVLVPMKIFCALVPKNGSTAIARGSRQYAEGRTKRAAPMDVVERKKREREDEPM